MRRMDVRRSVFAVVTAGAAVALYQAEAAPSQGGLSLTPAILEHAAQTGAVGSVTVANTSTKAMRVTIKARPWSQARNGKTSASRRSTLRRQVRMSRSAFQLAPGARQKVDLSLLRRPARGSLYGAVEVVGTPRGARRRRGITVAYRLIGSLRLNPPASARVLRLRAGAPKASRRGIVLPVRNTGNTIEPVGGNVRISGPRGTRRGSIRPVKILPGKLVHLSLGSTRGLPRGTYTAAVSLTQARRQIASVRRRVRVR